MRGGRPREGGRKKSSLTLEEDLLERVSKDAGYAADALHAALHSRMPGTDEAPNEAERETFEELEYAGELMLVQFLSLIRTFLAPKKKG